MKNRLVVLAVATLALALLMGAAPMGSMSSILFGASPPIFRPDTGTGWATPSLPNYRESLAVTQMPSTATAPTKDSDGFALINSNPYDLHVEIMTNPQEPGTDAGTCDPTTAADKDANSGFAANTLPTEWLKAYVYNPANGKWSRAPLLDVQIQGGDTTFVKTGITPPSQVSRVAYALPATAVCPKKVYIISR